MATARTRLAARFEPLRRSGRARIQFGIGLATFVGLAVVVALIAVKPIFLGYDSINNYVHVWFISQSLFGAGDVPLRVPWLESGQALTYPYAWLPWTLAALARPVVGDYAVTWTMLLGFLLMVLVVYKISLRSDAWLLVLFLLYPLQLNGLLSFQLAFVWGSLFGYLYIHALEEHAKWQALLWYVLALSTHLVMMAPILVAYNLFIWFSQRERRQLILWVVLFSLPVVSAIAWYSLQAPSVGTSSPVFLFLAILETAVTRSTLFSLPFLLLRVKKLLSRSTLGVALAAAMLAVSVSITIPFGALQGLGTQAADPYEGFLASTSFSPGAHYRILEASNREQGHYFFVQRGAVLAQELFSESQVRRKWKPSMYVCFLTAKRIDYVVVNRNYVQMFRTNEEQILENLVSQGLAQLAYVDAEDKFKVYNVRDVRQGSPLPVRRCFKGLL